MSASTAVVPAKSSWRWSSWSLTRKLPVLTGVVIVLVVATSLALTYDALTRARMATVHERLRELTIQLAQTTQQGLRARTAVYRQAAADSAVLAVFHAASAGSPAADSSPASRAATARLLRLRAQPDSSLPIELWTVDGRRILHVGIDVRGDTSVSLRPEMRTLSGKTITEIPSAGELSDSVHHGALYASGGKVLYWTIVPVTDHGRHLGYLAQQRAVRSSAQAERLVKELIGNDASLYLHNTTDGFWSSFLGVPTGPLTEIDTVRGDFVGDRQDIGAVTSYDARIAGTPWAMSLEAPVSTVLAEPRATLRRLMLLSFLIGGAGVIVAGIASRRITRPLTTLASVSEAIARGAYETRMPQARLQPTRDEVTRLASSFNRMATEIEASHHELEQQVEEALAVSTELEQTNEQLQDLSSDAEEARDAAQEANRAKSDFLAVMSHELRTPLNAIGGYAEILQLGIYGTVTEQQRDALGRIVRSQQMLLSLINDVLNFAKLDAGQVKYRMEDVLLERVLSSVEMLIAPQLRAKRLHYTFDGCPPTLTVRADQDKLQQVVLNLLTNAIKFTAEEGSITLSCDVGEEVVRVRVTDTGIGIPAERMEAIFDPFVQVDRALNRPHEGVGLGLSISRDLARGMGGTLTAESKQGTGSVFTLGLRRRTHIG